MFFLAIVTLLCRAFFELGFVINRLRKRNEPQCNFRVCLGSFNAFNFYCSAYSMFRCIIYYLICVSLLAFFGGVVYIVLLFKVFASTNLFFFGGMKYVVEELLLPSMCFFVRVSVGNTLH